MSKAPNAAAIGGNDVDREDKLPNIDINYDHANMKVVNEVEAKYLEHKRGRPRKGE